jgi:hypothetical protein
VTVKGVKGLPGLASRVWAVKLPIPHTLHASTIRSLAATCCRPVKGVEGFRLCAPHARAKSRKPFTSFTPGLVALPGRCPGEDPAS